MLETANLNEFLTNIAENIRTLHQKEDKISPQDFRTQITDNNFKANNIKDSTKIFGMDGTYTITYEEPEVIIGTEPGTIKAAANKRVNSVMLKDIAGAEAFDTDVIKNNTLILGTKGTCTGADSLPTCIATIENPSSYSYNVGQVAVTYATNNDYALNTVEIASGTSQTIEYVDLERTCLRVTATQGRAALLVAVENTNDTWERDKFSSDQYIWLQSKSDTKSNMSPKIITRCSQGGHMSLTVNYKSDYAQLSWRTLSYAAKYSVYRGPNLLTTIEAEHDANTQLSYKIYPEDLPTYRYEYWVVAKDSEGNDTGSCNAVIVYRAQIHSHTYVNGVCTVCGAKDPSYTPPEEPTYHTVKITNRAFTGPIYVENNNGYPSNTYVAFNETALMNVQAGTQIRINSYNDAANIGYYSNEYSNKEASASSHDILINQNGSIEVVRSAENGIALDVVYNETSRDATLRWTKVYGATSYSIQQTDTLDIPNSWTLYASTSNNTYTLRDSSDINNKPWFRVNTTLNDGTTVLTNKAIEVNYKINKMYVVQDGASKIQIGFSGGAEVENYYYELASNGQTTVGTIQQLAPGVSIGASGIIDLSTLTAIDDEEGGTLKFYCWESGYIKSASDIINITTNRQIESIVQSSQ